MREYHLDYISIAYNFLYQGQISLKLSESLAIDGSSMTAGYFAWQNLFWNIYGSTFQLISSRKWENVIFSSRKWASLAQNKKISRIASRSTRKICFTERVDLAIYNVSEDSSGAKSNFGPPTKIQPKWILQILGSNIPYLSIGIVSKHLPTAKLSLESWFYCV